MMTFRNRLQISLQILHETVTYYIKNHLLSFRYKKNFHCCQSYYVLMICHSSNNPANICLFKVNNRNIKKRCEISSKLTIIKTLELRQWLFMVLLYLNIFHTFVTSPLFLTELSLSWRRSLSYRNQSIDLLSKSMDWFLHHRDLRHKRVKKNLSTRLLFIPCI